MNTQNNNPLKLSLELEKLYELNSLGYAGKFSLGETVVLTCGPWDKASNTFWERNCYNARRNS